MNIVGYGTVFVVVHVALPRLELQETLLPFRMLGNLVLRATSGLADSALAVARFLTEFADSLANHFCGNAEKLSQVLCRKTVGSDRLARNKMPSLLFIECHKERYFLFLETYWGFLLQPCNCWKSIKKTRRCLQLFVIYSVENQ